MSKRVNFDDIIQMVTQPLVGKNDLSIWAGRCAEGDLLAFLQGWENLPSMPYRIWEYVSDIVFEKDALPKDVVLLQRGRLFGEGGDLEVRRDGTEFAWRFVGPSGVRPPAGYDNEKNNFWHRHPDVAFHQYGQTALLWGKHREDNWWYDDRVGSALLNYPASGTRVQVHYKIFSRAGQIQFVWYTGLNEWKEDTNG